MYPYIRIPTALFDNIPEGYSFGHSENGWMTSETFYEYITNVFYPWCVAKELEFPIILYMDGHASHATLPLAEFCVEHHIELISLYPNSTQVSQPLDVAYFRSLKSEWQTAATNFRVERVSRE